MTKDQKLPISAKAMATIALIVLTNATQLPELAGSAATIFGLSSAILCRALELTPSLAPVVLQALQVLGLHYGDPVLCALHLLVSYFPLLRFLAGVA